MSSINTGFNSINSIPDFRVRNVASGFDATGAEKAEASRFLPSAQSRLSDQNAADLKQSQALGTVTTALTALGTTISGFTFQNSAQSPNAAALTQDVTAFVAAYNQAINQVSRASQNTTDSTAELSVSKTQSTLRRLSDHLGENVTMAQAASTYSVNSAAALGITTNSDGTLSLDPNVLSAASQSDPNGSAATLFGDTQNQTQGLFQTVAAYVAEQTDTATGALATEARALAQDALTESSYARQVGYAASTYQDALRDKYAAVQGALASLHAEQEIVSATLEGGNMAPTDAPPSTPFEMPGETAYGSAV